MLGPNGTGSVCHLLACTVPGVPVLCQLAVDCQPGCLQLNRLIRALSQAPQYLDELASISVQCVVAPIVPYKSECQPQQCLVCFSNKDAGDCPTRGRQAAMMLDLLLWTRKQSVHAFYVITHVTLTVFNPMPEATAVLAGLARSMLHTGTLQTSTYFEAAPPVL